MSPDIAVISTTRRRRLRTIAHWTASFLAVAALSVAQQDQKVVTIQSLNAYDILYVLSGGGANAMALMRDDGVVLIDPLPVGWGKASLASIQTVSDQPVRTIVNIRSSEEDLAANGEYPDASRIVAHQNLAARAKQMPAFAGARAKLVPNVLVADRLSLLDGPDRMEIQYFGPGRTDSDLLVVFPEKRVAYAGDLLPSKSAPVIERAKGGSALLLPQTLAKIVAQVKNVRTVVPGREPPTVGQIGAAKPGAVMPMPSTMNWKDLEEYAEFTREFAAAVQAARSANKTTPEAAVQGLALPARFKAYDMRAAAATAAAIYSEASGR